MIFLGGSFQPAVIAFLSGLGPVGISLGTGGFPPDGGIGGNLDFESDILGRCIASK